MNRIARKAAVVGAGLVSLASYASVGSVASASAKAPHARAGIVLIQAGSNDFSSVDVPYFAHLMQADGVNVTVDTIADASTALRTVVAGQSDLFVGSLPTAVLAVSNGGAQIKVIAANDQASDYVLVSLPQYTLKNLSGATMGIDTPGSAGQVAAEVGMEKLGLDPTKVNYVSIGGSSARLTAILAGKVDLAPLHYPNALTAIATGKVKELINIGKVIGPYLQSGLIASNNFLKNDPRLSQLAVNDFILAERWAATNEKGYLSFGNQQQLGGGLTFSQEESVWKFYKAVNYFGVNGGLCSSYVTDFLTLNYKLGGLTRAETPPRSQWLDTTYVNNFLKAHGQKSGTC